jgi:tRNA(fMet)-specific endonuclease VapC
LTLLDTNVLIHYLKGNPLIVERIQSSAKRELAIACVAVYELEYGTLKAKGAWRRNRLEAVLADLEHVPFDSAAAIAAARIRVELETRGTSIGPLDLLIAGTALSRGATLVTNNIQEFSRVPGLHVVDWKST